MRATGRGDFPSFFFCCFQFYFHEISDILILYNYVMEAEAWTVMRS